MTGMSGAGKTMVLYVLAGRGLTTLDTDYGDWVLPDGTWDEPRMDQLLGDHRDVVFAGTVSDQGRFYARFAHGSAFPTAGCQQR